MLRYSTRNLSYVAQIVASTSPSFVKMNMLIDIVNEEDFLLDGEVFKFLIPYMYFLDVITLHRLSTIQVRG